MDSDEGPSWMVLLALWLILSVIVIMASCATVHTIEPLATLQISNDDAVPLQLLLNDGGGPRPWHRAYPGVTCLVLGRRDSNIAIGVRKLADSEVYWTPPFAPSSQPGWTLRIGHALPVDIWSFQGVAARCTPGGKQ